MTALLNPQRAYSIPGLMNWRLIREGGLMEEGGSLISNL